MRHGRLLAPRSIASRHLGARRAVHLYLPPSYDREPRRRYPVLYLHDGQNMFSSAGPECCFGWGSWDLDNTVDVLCASRQMREIIMVAVENSPARYREYRGPVPPRGAHEPAAAKRQRAGTGESTAFENYSRFLCQELKPRIDLEFRTMREAASTGLLGASLGGLCSLALGWNHPRTFGLVASLSGAFQVGRRHFLAHVLRPYSGRRKPLKIYLDSGTIDTTGDDDGCHDTAAVAAELRRIGWRDDVNLEYFVDDRLVSHAEAERAGLPRPKVDEARRGQHNEFYWRRRVWRALVFLFPEGS